MRPRAALLVAPAALRAKTVCAGAPECARLFALAACVLALSGCSRSPAAVTATVPHATLVTLSGNSVELAQMIQGRVVLVSLWATWCDACAKEFDALNRLSAGALARGDALVVGIAVGESRATVDAFVRLHDVRYEQLVDEDFHLADALGQRDIPATLVMDRTGQIVYRGEALDRESLAAFRKALLPVTETRPLRTQSDASR